MKKFLIIFIRRTNFDSHTESLHMYVQIRAQSNMHHVSQHLTNRKQLNWCPSLRRDRTKERQYFWKVDLKRGDDSLPLFPRAAPLFMYLQKRRANEWKGKKTATVFSTSVCEGYAAREEWRPSFRCFQL